MALFHFDNNREVKLENPNLILRTGLSNDNELLNTVWNGEFSDDFSGDIVTVGSSDNKQAISSDKSSKRKAVEHISHSSNFSIQELNDLKDEEKASQIHEEHKRKIYEDLIKYYRYNEKYPENKYEIEIVFNGKYYDSYVYHKDFKTVKQENPLILEERVNDFINGNFDVINDITNPVEFVNEYRKKTGGKTMYSSMISAYNDGKISSGKVVGYLNTLHQKFWEFEAEYDDYDPESKLGGTSLGGVYYELYSRVKQYFQRENELRSKYENNKVDKSQVKELQRFIKEKYNVELNEIAAAEMLNAKEKYKIYSYDNNKILDFLKNNEFLKDDVEYILNRRGDKDYFDCVQVDKEQAQKVKDIVKARTGVELSDKEAMGLLEFNKDNGEIIKVDIEKLKSDCLSGEFNFAGDDCEGYLKNILTYSGNGYNDSLESLETVAQTVEVEFQRYDFDVHNSQISDLATQSDKMRADGEKNLTVRSSKDKITITNNVTGQVRTIDLKSLTEKLDNKHKKIFLNSLMGFNKISLWEFAIEIKTSIDMNVEKWSRALAQYDTEKDTIKIGDKVDSNTLLHEMIHAMMSTVIDGKNTSNEDLFKDFVDTFNEEQRVHKYEKQLSNTCLGGNYTYCAESIYEFAAEAGCLWLSGKSDSEFTIATHFPKSYRLFIQLIEKIRKQDTNRSLG